jgi:hypothetical protein
MVVLQQMLLLVVEHLHIIVFNHINIYIKILDIQYKNLEYYIVH